jgi:tetratricopeptide (TPR) repeat protein
MDSIMKEDLAKIECLAGKERYEEAITCLDELLEKYGNQSQVWELRAHVNALQGNSEAAVADLSRALKLKSDEPHPFYIRGIHLIKVARYKEAVADFTKVIELCDFYKSDYYREGAYFFRAEAYLRLGLYDMARTDCKHVRDDFSTWIDGMRSKQDILHQCSLNPDRKTRS